MSNIPNYYGVEGHAPPPPSAAQLINNRPACPVMWYQDGNTLLAIPLAHLDLLVEFHVATAFARINATFVNTSNRAVNLLFAIPVSGTVTDVGVRIGHDRLLDTTYIPSDEAAKLDQSRKENNGAPQVSSSDEFVPDLFRLPIPNVGAGEEITIALNYLQPLAFRHGSYHFESRLSFPPGSIANIPFQELLSLRCIINCVMPGIQYNSPSHQLMCTRQQNLRVELVAIPTTPQLVDFQFSYSMRSDGIVGTLIQQNAAPESFDQRPSFLLFVTPPSNPIGEFARDFMILLDRSGSMYGEPFAEATRALNHAFGTMKPMDRFNLVAFDHESIVFNPGLVPACPENFQMAFQWLQSMLPRGGTDMKTPLLDALRRLNQEAQQTKRMPFVLLLTDGCVDGERQLCRDVEAACGQVRVFTFGIGPYCNWFFLKMVSQVTRGFSESVIYKDKIFEKILQLMEMASNPVLRDVSLAIVGTTSVELYPFPIPDLFVGAPLTVAAKYTGILPEFLIMQGTLPSGQTIRQQINTTFTEVIPVDKVFLKQRVDLLTAKQWLEDSKDIKEQLVEISCTQHVPTPFTSMVSYETTEKKIEDEKNQKGKEKKASKRNVAKVSALAVGSVVVVGAAVFAFGDVGATLGNVSSLASGAGNIFGGIGDALDGSCFGSCGDMLGCGDCGNACGDLFGGVCGCGELCNSIGDTCGDACGDVAKAGSSLCSGLIGVCSCDGIDDCCGEIGSVFSGCVELLGGLFKD